MNEGDGFIVEAQDEAEIRALTMLRGLGRVSNETGISNADDPSRFEPRGSADSPIHAEMELIWAHVISEDDAKFSLVLEVPVWEKCGNIEAHDLKEIIRTFNKLDPKFRVRNVEAESGVEKEIELRFEVQYKIALDLLELSELKSKIRRFMDISMNLLGTIYQTNQRGKLLGFQASLGSRVGKSAQPRRNVPLSEIEDLVGLEPVKKWVRRSVVDQGYSQHPEKTRPDEGNIASHLIFVGKPGTGKSTVAHSLARLYKDLCFLSNGHVVELFMSDVEARLLGRSEVKMREVCENAIGGVLFIEVASSRLEWLRQLLGDDEIPNLLTFMERHRNDLLVILAGDSPQMEYVFESYPRLRDLFKTELNFPDLGLFELQQLFDRLISHHEFVIEPWARELVISILSGLSTRPGFENARDVRVLFENIYLNLEARCDSQGLKSLSERRLILVEDVRPLVGIAVE